MFEPASAPRVFALPPGSDFPAELLAGLETRMDGQPPEAWARILLIVNTRRMARRLRDMFEAGPPRLLPQIRLMTDLGTELTTLPPPIPPLRRRLELTQLVARLVEAAPDLAPRAAVYDLADSLADLFAEMQGEGVGPEKIAELDVSDVSGHWARAQRFITIAGALADPDAPEAEARQRLVAEALAERWATNPPQTPVILAGSTGSRGMMQILMNAVARLPQGAVVLPGYDDDLPEPVWQGMADQLTAEDHPQYRYKALMERMKIAPGDILPWTEARPPAPDRNRVISLALRPAPVTDAWLSEGPSLPGLVPAMADVTLVEADDPRSEALAIALRLRQAVEDGQTTALITPDRMLTRQVEAALDRWGIIADDSAGQPLHLAPPGRFLRQIAELEAEPATPETLLALLKHPLCHSGPGRGDHLIHTRDLELWLRRNAPPHPDRATLETFAADMTSIDRTPPPEDWRDWVARTFLTTPDPEPRPLPQRVADVRARAELAAGGSQEPEKGTGGLWDQNAGREAQKVLTGLEEHAEAGGEMAARDVEVLLGALLQRETVRDRDNPHPTVMIWGTLEARVQGADLLILGGLNEGSWPEAAKPDPWLNRQLRKEAGLLLPERRIGLSAHDFQQAAGAPEVWMTRAKRSSDAETVPSRWVNRLTNLLGGLPQRDGPEALAQMRARGRTWLDWARAMEEAPAIPAAPRPAPRPPVDARPQKLSVTQIKTLIRDPYAIYARHVLRLRPLDPLLTTPDALLRGTVLHEVLEVFLKGAETHGITEDALMSVADRILREKVPWAAERRLWRARLARVAGWFVAGERIRQEIETPQAFEVRGQAVLTDPPFRLTGTADRIDRDGRGNWVIYDYKTGRPPSKKEQKLFDKQLLLEAAMVTEGGFHGLDAGPVARAVFLGLSGTGVEEPAPLDETPVAQVWAEFRELLMAYRDPEQGYTSRRMLQKDTDVGDYDQLARFGEWDMADNPTPEDLT